MNNASIIYGARSDNVKLVPILRTTKAHSDDSVVASPTAPHRVVPDQVLKANRMHLIPRCATVRGTGVTVSMNPVVVFPTKCSSGLQMS